MLLFLGAEVVLTPREQGMKGAIAKSHEILAENPGAVMPDQFANPANPAIHRRTTAEEIWADTGGLVDIIVSGIGTGLGAAFLLPPIRWKRPAGSWGTAQLYWAESPSTNPPPPRLS